MNDAGYGHYVAADNRYDGMRYFNCGNSGLKLSAVSLGLWHNFGSNASFDNMLELCHTAFDNGITHFDLANNYGPVAGAAEANFGRILKNSLGVYRDELVISTKAGYGMWPGPYGDGGSKKYLVASLDQSLKRMGLDYVDIFYHHRPDDETPIEETMLALDGIVRSGKALYVGISNYSRTQTEIAMDILRELGTPFVLHQSSYSMLNRKIEKSGLKHYVADNGVGIIAFCPLEQGLLTDKYLQGIPEDSRVRRDGRFLNESAITLDKLEKIKALNEIALERGETLAQMALSWILRDGEVTSVLVGASKPSQIIDNVRMVKGKCFTEEELNAIDRITLG